MLATPSYTGAVSPGHIHALVKSLELLKKHKDIAVDHVLLAENCHVDDARNAIVRQFWLSECSKLVFLDSDVAWNPEDLLTLIKYDADIVAGVYPKRAEDQDEYPVYVLPGERWAREDGLVEVEGAPTGFMAISRKAIGMLMAAKADKQFKTNTMKPEELPYTVIFERTLEEGKRWSGDYAFCRAFRRLGGKIFVAPEMRFAHEGTKEWVGSLGDFWRASCNIEHPQLRQALNKIRSNEPKPMDFVELYNAYGSNYAAPPGQLAAMFEMARLCDQPILETGSGLSTLVLGIAAEIANVQLHSLEHDLGHFHSTKKLLEAHAVHNVNLYYCPLKEYQGFVWYEIPDDLLEGAPFGLVVCDGPQRQYGRSGLFALLYPFFPKAPVILDDAHDPEILNLTKTFCAAQGRQFAVHGEGHTFAICLPPGASMAA